MLTSVSAACLCSAWLKPATYKTQAKLGPPPCNNIKTGGLFLGAKPEEQENSWRLVTTPTEISYLCGPVPVRNQPLPPPAVLVYTAELLLT